MTGVLSWIVTPLIWLFETLLSGYVSIFIVLFLTSPFHGYWRSGRRTRDRERTLTIHPPCKQCSQYRGFIREIQKIMHYIPMALLVLVISFIPAVNIVAPLLWILLGAWMMSCSLLITQWITIVYPSARRVTPVVRDGQHRLPSRRRGLCVWTTHP